MADCRDRPQEYGKLLIRGEFDPETADELMEFFREMVKIAGGADIGLTYGFTHGIETD